MMLLRRSVKALLPLAILWAADAEAHSRHLRPQPLPRVVFPAPTTAPYRVTVDANPAHVLNRFSPDAAFGAGVDGVPFHAVPEIYTPSNVGKMLGAGFGPVSYRLYTELSVQDWHWNPTGSYSEAGGQGYWTSSARPARSIVNTYGRNARGNDHHSNRYSSI